MDCVKEAVKIYSEKQFFIAFLNLLPNFQKQQVFD